MGSHKEHTWEGEAEDSEKLDGGSSNTVTQAANKNDCTKIDIKHDSRFRITPVTNMNSDMRRGAEPMLNKDTKKKNDSSSTYDQ